MKMRCRILVEALLVVTIFSACEKGEPQNNEADIITFSIAEYGKVVEVATSDDIINYYLPDTYTEEMKKSLTPVITISGNATISPKTGVPMDFSSPVEFKVTSEDGRWTRTYTVNMCNFDGDFEQWQGTGSGTNYFEVPVGWCSANSGVTQIHNLGYKTIEYPTYKTTDAYNGNYAVALETRKGGQSSLIPKLISGSLFLGTMSNVTLASLSNPLLLTKFGISYNYSTLPDSLIGYLKYTPGANYQNENGDIVADKVDSCSFYAVLFEGDTPLDGTNIQSSDRIVAIAKYKYDTPISSTQFTRLSLPFVYLKQPTEGTALQYSIIASSSINGDLYIGAAGSLLIIDKVDIKLKKSK